MSWKRDSVIFKQEGSYSCFPGLAQLSDGRLVVPFTQRDWPTHHAPGRLRVFTSPDGGESWQETQDTSLSPLWKGARGNFRRVLADGSWLVAGTSGWDMLPSTERAQREAQGYCTHDHESDPDLFYLSRRDFTISKSRDGGTTWQRQTIPAPEDMVTFHSFRGIVLKDGTLLVPIGGSAHKPGLNLRTLEGAARRQYMARSTDGGETWELAQMIEDPQGQYTEEVALVELRDGRVLALARVQGLGDTGYLWQQASVDGGQTWSEAVETRIWGYPAHLLQLQDGRLLCSYGYRREPAGIRAVVSNNGGWSWDLADERILRDDGGTPAQAWSAADLKLFKTKAGLAGAPDLGYPRSIQLADGTIFSVYYFTAKDGITHVAATKWRLDGDL